MILLATLIVIRHLICGHSKSWHLVKEKPLVSLKKLVSFDWSNNSATIHVKMSEFVLE